MARENSEVLVLHRLISISITASTPYAKELGVSLVDLRGVLRYTYNMFGNSSVHLPFAPSSLFFNPLTITLFVASAGPLLWGYARVEYLFFMSMLLLAKSLTVKLQPII